MAELHRLHADSLLPKLCKCGANLQTLAKTFVDHCPEICKQYRRWTQIKLSTYLLSIIIYNVVDTVRT